MRLVFDLEADGWRDTATQVWCLVTQDVDTGEVKQWTKPPKGEYFFRVGWRTAAKLEDILGKADELIGHNIIDYDLPLLERLYGWTPSPHTKITDTVIMSRLLRSDRVLPSGCPSNCAPHSLEAWGYRVGRGKPDHTDWTRYSPGMLYRCTEDVAINKLVYEALLREANSGAIDWTEALEAEHAISKLIVKQEQTGVPLDLHKVWTTRLELVDKMRVIDGELVPVIPRVRVPKAQQGTWPKVQFRKDGLPTINALRYYGEEFGTSLQYRTDLIVKTAPINLRSAAQVKEYLLSIGWRPTEWNYKKGASGKPLRDPMGNKIRTSPKLTLDSLESCVWPEDSQEMGEKLCEYLMLGHREGMLRGWLRDVRSDGRISAKAIACGTPTGRMTHRQVVNVPRNSSPYGTELRSCFTSIPGYTRVGIDLSSCQLRGLCHYMEDEEFQGHVIEGSPHEYAAEMAGLVGDNKMSAKDKGKKLNYTVLFGGGDEKVATSLGITVVEAVKVRKTFFKNLPALERLQKNLKRQWKAKGYLEGLDGRAIWVRAEHMLLVYLMQGLESVVIKNFMINVEREAKSFSLDYQLVTTSHDETQYLVNNDECTTFCAVAHTSIAEVNAKFNLTCPQAIDISLGTTWAECH